MCNKTFAANVLLEKRLMFENILRQAEGVCWEGQQASQPGQRDIARLTRALFCVVQQAVNSCSLRPSIGPRRNELND